MTNPDPVIVQHYAVLNNMSMKEAREKLKENYEVESSKIPLKDLVLRCLHGIRQMSPTVEGLKIREQDVIARLQKLENGLTRIARQLEEDSTLRERVARLEDEQLEFEKELTSYLKNTERLLTICEEQQDQIDKLSKPWWKKIF
jgi:hypothetical protein